MKEEQKRLTALEINQQNIMDKLDNIIERFNKLEEKLDQMLEKKADKWVERVLIWFGIIIGTGVLGFIGLQIIKVIEKL